MAVQSNSAISRYSSRLLGVADVDLLTPGHGLGTTPPAVQGSRRPRPPLRDVAAARLPTSTFLSRVAEGANDRASREQRGGFFLPDAGQHLLRRGSVVLGVGHGVRLS